MALVGELHLDQHFFGFFDHVALARHGGKRVHLERPVTFGKAGDQHVFLHTEIAKDLGRLKYARNPHLVDLVGFAPQHRLPVEHNRSGIGDQFAHQTVQQRGFTRPVRPDNGMDRIFRNAEVHVAQRLQPAETFADIFDFENGHLFSSFLFGWGCVALCGGVGFDRSRVPVLATEHATDALATFDQTTGQEDHDQHEQQTQG